MSNAAMGRMKVGYYPILSDSSEHAYSIMQYNGKQYDFACYGGTNDSKNVYPAYYYYDRNMWYTRSGSKTSYTDLECHPQIAIHLATWLANIDMKYLNYNRKSGGYNNLGDSSGIIYALSGVCHQMCNIILYSTNVKDPENSLINWPPSLNSSKLIYGNRGLYGIDTHAREWVKKLVEYYNKYSNVNSSSEKYLQDIFDDMNEQLKYELKTGLSTSISREERFDFIENILNQHTDSNNISVINDNIIEGIVEIDTKVISTKHNLDNLLIRDQISTQEYANNMNEQVRYLVTRYAETLGENNFAETFGTSPEKVNTDIISVDMMPQSYQGIKEALKI